MSDDTNSGSAQGLDGEMIKGDPFQIVQEIERILADDPDDRIVAADSIEFPLKDALDLMPRRYLKDVDPEEIYGETVLVTPDNLFDQLARGKVEVPLSKLAYYIPLHLIYHVALNEEGSVVLPLKKVVKAVGLDELKKRTPDNFRIYDISVFDDPFKEGDAVFSEDSGLILDDTDDEQQESEVPLLLEDDPAEEEIPDEPIESESDVDSIEPVMLSDTPDVQAFEGATEPVLASEEEGGSISILYPLNALVKKGSAEPVFNLDGADENQMIELQIPDLIHQLRRGTVTLSVTSLVESFPNGVLADDFAGGGSELVTLDLKETVKGVGIEVLKANTPSRLRAYDIDWMADPFEEPAEKPDLASVRVGKKEKKKADEADRALNVREEAPVQSPKITVYKPSSETDSELDYYELPGNININAAYAEELMLLKGVDGFLADAIVAYRSERGIFKSVFDLFKVDGVDEVVFRQMTGMKAEHKRRHRRRRLASMLKISAVQVADLSAVAEAVARKSGFSGCMIADMDGLVLASAGVGESGADLSAVLPVTLKQMSHNISLAGLNFAGTLTFAVEGQLYSVHGSENVILGAAHAENMINESDLSFIRKVGRELAWLLSVRAYAGPSA